MQRGTKSKGSSRRSGAGGTIFAPAVYPRKISTTSTQHFCQSVFSSKNRPKNDGVCCSENSSPRFVFVQSTSSFAPLYAVELSATGPIHAPDATRVLASALSLRQPVNKQ